MRIVFANVTQCFVYANEVAESESMLFKKFSIPDYIEYFKNINPDILCLSEVLIDDEENNSEFISRLSEACNLKYYKILRSEKSWIYVGKFYGMAIISKYPIMNYEFFKLPNPKFEIDRPNGDHWIMHDKYAQYAKINTINKNISLFNLHYFPVHHFKKDIDDLEMKKPREELTKYFMKETLDAPTIITGDFNNKNKKLVKVFPELFEFGYLQEAIETDTTIVNGNSQLDHILYTPAYFELISSKAEKFLSDHYSLIVDIE